MPKYTKEFKIKLVLEYLSGESGGIKSIAKIYSIPKSTLELWINQYKSKGFDNLSKKLKNTKSNKKSKLNIPISESEREELIRLREENRLLKMKIIYEKKLQALLLEEEAEARKRQR